MPGFDGNGPMGPGPRRGLGPCGRGFGRSQGRGFGRSQGFFKFQRPTEWFPTKDEQKKILEEELNCLEEEIKQIKQKLKELN